MLICAVIGIVIERLCYRPLRGSPEANRAHHRHRRLPVHRKCGPICVRSQPQSFPELITDRALEIPAFFGAFSALTITAGQLIVVGVDAAFADRPRAIVLYTRWAWRCERCPSTLWRRLSWASIPTSSSRSPLAWAQRWPERPEFSPLIQQPSIDPLMGVNAGLKAFVAAVLGGIGNIPGAALGGVLIGFLEALVVGYINPTYRDPIVFAVLILILLLKPAGLLGKSEREKV